jgi:hypothetical protein
VDARTKTKIVNALMTQFIKLYEQKYGIKPRFNRYTEKWGFEYFLEDCGASAQDLLDYYFTLNRSHTVQDFLRNYQDLSEWMTEDAADEEYRRQLREATKKKVEEFESQWHPKP